MINHGSYWNELLSRKRIIQEYSRSIYKWSFFLFFLLLLSSIYERLCIRRGTHWYNVAEIVCNTSSRRLIGENVCGTSTCRLQIWKWVTKVFKREIRERERKWERDRERKKRNQQKATKRAQSITKCSRWCSSQISGEKASILFNLLGPITPKLVFHYLP